MGKIHPERYHKIIQSGRGFGRSQLAYGFVQSGFKILHVETAQHLRVNLFRYVIIPIV